MPKVENDAIFSDNDARLQFHRKLRQHNLAEGYSYDKNQLTPRSYWPTQPVNEVKPHLWKWSILNELVRESGQLVGLGHGDNTYDRRVIALTNPGLDNEYAITSSLFADFQIIRPGERTPSHRHTPCATRFIFEGEGWTTVGGDKVDFEKGDIVFTGQFPWHDHGNRGQEDLIFLDVLDIPLLQFLGISKWEFDYWEQSGSRTELSSPVEKHNLDESLLPQAGLRFCNPSFRRKAKDFAHLKWRPTRNRLLQNSKEIGSAYDGILYEFCNAETGGAIGPAMSVFAQMLRPGENTLEHRHTSQTVYVGIEGRGKCVIDGVDFEWGPKDVFVVPSWSWHRHENLSKNEPAFLHSISDAALISKLNLFREQGRSKDEKITDSHWQSHYFNSER